MSAPVDQLSLFVAQHHGELYFDVRRPTLGCLGSCRVAVLSDALLLAMQCDFHEWFCLCIHTEMLSDARLLALLLLWLDEPNAGQLMLTLSLGIGGRLGVDSRLLRQIAERDRLCGFTFSGIIDSSQAQLCSVFQSWFSASTQLRRVNLEHIWPTAGFCVTCLPVLRALEHSATLTSVGLGLRFAPGDGASLLAFLEQTSLPIQLISLDFFNYDNVYRVLRSLRRFDLCEMGVRTTYMPLDTKSVDELLALFELQSRLRCLTLDPVCCSEADARAALIDRIAQRCKQLRSLSCSVPIWDETNDTAASSALFDLVLVAPSTLTELNVAPWRFGDEGGAYLADALVENFTILRMRVPSDLVQLPVLRQLIERNNSAAHWPTARRALLVIASALASLAWPPYVVLEVVDAMKRFRSTTHSRKVAVLVAVQQRAARAAYQRGEALI